jgi:hypothetical protein
METPNSSPSQPINNKKPVYKKWWFWIFVFPSLAMVAWMIVGLIYVGVNWNKFEAEKKTKDSLEALRIEHEKDSIQIVRTNFLNNLTPKQKDSLYLAENKDLVKVDSFDIFDTTHENTYFVKGHGGRRSYKSHYETVNVKDGFGFKAYISNNSQIPVKQVWLELVLKNPPSRHSDGIQLDTIILEKVNILPGKSKVIDFKSKKFIDFKIANLTVHSALNY